MDVILDSYEPYFASLSLKPSDGGRFEVTVDGALVYSKLDTDRFPGEEELTRVVGEKLGV